MPLQPRHAHAAVFRRGLPVDDIDRHGSSPLLPRVRAAAQPRSARFELVELT